MNQRDVAQGSTERFARVVERAYYLLENAHSEAFIACQGVILRSK